MDIGIVIDGTLAWIWDHLLAIIGWIIAMIAFVVVPFRRPPAEARNWLLIFFALPWVALPIYWMIGRPQYAKARQKRVADLPRILDRIVRQTGLDQPELSPRLCEDNHSLANLAHGLGQFPAVDGNRIEPLGDYDGAIDRVIADASAPSASSQVPDVLTPASSSSSRSGMPVYWRLWIMPWVYWQPFSCDPAHSMPLLAAHSRK